MVAPLNVLYLDNHLLVIDKPAGMLSQEDHTGDLDVLTQGKDFLKAHFNKPGNVFLGLVHRLDRPASGVMVFARTSKAAARLATQFQARTVDKRYVAMVEGHCKGSGTLQDFLVKENGHVRVVPPEQKGGKKAVLHWQAVAQSQGRSLLDVRLETGRPHQIRVQLAHMGFPLVGDFRYGAKTPLDGRNLALHCYRLCVDHPTQQKRLCWKIGPPLNWGNAFSSALQQLVAAKG